MGKAKDKPSTRWWLTNADDANQICFHFHGEGKPGNFEYDAHLARIRDAVIGEPKKMVIGIVEWVMKCEALHEAEMQNPEGGPVEPFIASSLFEQWARENCKGKHKYSPREAV
jgi:hypothetical protein